MKKKKRRNVTDFFLEKMVQKLFNLKFAYANASYATMLDSMQLD